MAVVRGVEIGVNSKEFVVFKQEKAREDCRTFRMNNLRSIAPGAETEANEVIGETTENCEWSQLRGGIFKRICPIEQGRGVLIDLIATLVLLVVFVLVLARVDLPLTSQTTFDSELELYSSRRVGQSFIAEGSGLYRLDLLLARRGPNSHPVIFHLQEDQVAPSDTVTVEVNASLLEDVSSPIRKPNTYKSFTFAPIEDSSGKRFFFYVESPLSTTEDPLLLKFQSHNAYLQGKRYVDGMEDSGDLAFKAYYKGAPLETSDLLLRRLSEGKPFPLSNKGIYVIALFTNLFLFVRLVHMMCV
ncbi:MAG: hypothetical protein NWE76_07395 [Candidatus Bathyarchaeota archaeon]|nr:hypothetical protein [Candidatus Bathyarchaeota archaeon]